MYVLLDSNIVTLIIIMLSLLNYMKFERQEDIYVGA